MRLAVIGSYGHCGVVTNSAAVGSTVELAGASPWGAEDALASASGPQALAGVSVFEDYRRMLDDVRPDVAAVFLPFHRLAEASLEAVRRGIHVFSEKPLAIRMRDLEALRCAVDSTGVQLAACMTARAASVFQAVRHAVAAGRIGEPVLASAQKSYPFARRDEYYKRRETYGGSIPWQAIHAIDFVSWCTGKAYTRVAAMHSNAAHPTHPGMEDNGGLLLEMDGGGHAVIRFDYLRPRGKPDRPWGDDRLRIAGTEAIVETAHAASRAVLTTPDGEEDLPLPARRDLFAEFVASVAGEGEPPISTAESLRITEVALLARDAADQGRVLPL